MPRKFLSRGQLIVMLIIFIVVSALGSSIYLASLSAQAAPQTAVTISWPFMFSISIDKSSCKQGVYNDNVSTTLTLRNISNKTIVVVWYSYFSIRRTILPFDVLIAYSNGTYVYQVSKVHGRLGSSLIKTLVPDAQLVATFVWYKWWETPERPLAPKGTYYLKANTFGPEYMIVDGIEQQMTQIETPTLSFTIR